MRRRGSKRREGTVAQARTSAPTACTAMMKRKRVVVVAAVMVEGGIAAPLRGRSMGCGCGRKTCEGERRRRWPA